MTNAASPAITSVPAQKITGFSAYDRATYKDSLVVPINVGREVSVARPVVVDVDKGNRKVFELVPGE